MPARGNRFRKFLEKQTHHDRVFIRKNESKTFILFWANGSFPAEKADHPVVGVSYYDAIAFCAWAAQSTGLPVRLPTEPEWEKAARGPEVRLYSWGNEWKKGACNIDEEKHNGTSPVGKFSPQGDSPYGVADMGGNVQEWCSSLFGPYPYDPADGREAHVYDLHDQNLLPKLIETGCTSMPEYRQPGCQLGSLHFLRRQASRAGAGRQILRAAPSATTRERACPEPVEGLSP